MNGKALYIDAGNSLIKCLIDKDFYRFSSISEFCLIFEKLRVNSVWIASVSLLGDDIKKMLDRKNVRYVNVNIRNNICNLSMTNDVCHSIGVDRWLMMIAAKAMYPSSSLCVVGIGTAVTLDRIDSSGRHKGGYIAPGLLLMSKSLADNTKNLSHLSSETILSKDLSVGLNTGDCIASGLLACIVGIIEKGRNQGGKSDILVVSGGDAIQMASQLPIDAVIIENLVLLGLQAYAEMVGY